MKCDVCHREFYSAYSDLVSVCSKCIARGAGAADAPRRQRSSAASRPDDSGEPADFIGGEELAGLFPDFEIGERLGAGGMGVVFLAHQKSLDRSVAIKVLKPRMQGDDGFEERFEREAKTMAMLGHPNIVGIHDFGIRGPYHFLVMEHVEGRDLQKLIRSGSLESTLAFSIIHQICDALHHAHERGIVHRDLKPGNILVGRDGVAKIGDFGLARIVETDSDVPLTMANAAMGTPAYMAPEQLNDARSSDARSDIFALGVVVYEMLTGSPPTGNFPPPTARLPHRNRRLDEAILRAMDPDPANRLPDLREISKIVAEWKLPAGAARVSPTSARGMWLLVPALAVVAAGLFWNLQKPSEAANEARATEEGSDFVEAIPLEPMLPAAAFPFDPGFELARRRGGIFRQWTSMGDPLPQCPDVGVDDLVALHRLRWVRGWMGIRSDGSNVSNFNPLNKMRGIFRSSGYFHLRWDHEFTHWPPHPALKMADNIPKRAVDVAQTSDFAVLVTPERRAVFVTAPRWQPIVSQLEERLETVNDVVSVKGFGFMFALLRESGQVIAWHLEAGIFPEVENAGPFVQIAVGHVYVVGLGRDQKLTAWSNDRFSAFDPIQRSLRVPELEDKIVRIKSTASVNAAQREDGSWIAWGNDDSGLIEKINSLGPVPDLMIFEPAQGAASTLAWIEPRGSDPGDGEVTSSSETVSPPSLEKLLPQTGLRGTDKFERMRRHGGVLRRWSEKPGVADIEDASGIDDLVFVEWAPRSATRWYAARSNGEMISSQTGLGDRSDYRRISHSFLIEWPDRLVSLWFPPSAQETLPFLEPIPRASELTQSYDVALVLTPEHRIALAAKDSWVKSNRHVIDRLHALRDVIAVDSMVNQFVVLTAEGKAISWCEPNGFFDPPDDARKLVQVAAGAKHLIGLYEDGSVVTWCHKISWMQSWLPSVMRVPPDLGPIIRVASFGSINAVQRPDGSWIAWGDDGNRGLIDKINSIGPALDIEAFRVTFSTGAKLIWIEPAALPDEKTAGESPTPPGQ